MDRTSWIGVLVCLTLLFGWGWWNAKEAARIAAERPVPVATDAPGTGVPATTAAGSPVAATPTLEASAPQAANAPALEKTVL